MTGTTNMPGGTVAKKVLGATIGAGGGAVTADFVLWCISGLFFDGGDLPTQVQAFVLFVVTSAVAGAAGYWTPRGLEELLPPTPRGQHESVVAPAEPPEH